MVEVDSRPPSTIITFVTAIHNKPPADPDTRALVRAAAEQLTRAGKRVSVRAVRAILGRGSDTTIADELRTWRETDLPAHVKPELNLFDRLPVELGAAAEHLYLLALTAAADRFRQQTVAANETTQSALSGQTGLLTELRQVSERAATVALQLNEAIADRASLVAQLREREIEVLRVSSDLAASQRLNADFTLEVSTLKSEVANRERAALARAEALSRHLLKATEDQRNALSATMATLRERLQAAQDRELLLTHQVQTLKQELETQRSSSSTRPGP